METHSAYYQLENRHNAHDMLQIKCGLDTLEGVAAVSVNTKTGRLAVDYDSTAVDTTQIKRVLERLGCEFSTLPAPSSSEK